MQHTHCTKVDAIKDEAKVRLTRYMGDLEKPSQSGLDQQPERRSEIQIIPAVRSLAPAVVAPLTAHRRPAS